VQLAHQKLLVNHVLPIIFYKEISVIIHAIQITMEIPILFANYVIIVAKHVMVQEIKNA